MNLVTGHGLSHFGGSEENVRWVDYLPGRQCLSRTWKRGGKE